MLTVYSKHNCMPCEMTKRHLTNLGIPYKEININEQPTAVDDLITNGFQGVPVVLTDDDWSTAFTGFQPERLELLK